jgi:cysteine-S-conjugate beta-lyase
MGKYNFDEIIKRENTNSFKFDWRHKYFGTQNVYPMWVADMDFKTPPFVIDSLKKRLEHEILGYSFLPENFNSSVVQWMQKRHGWTIKPEWITYSPGVVPSLNMAVTTLTQPGDKIIVQTPVYYPFFQAIKNHKRRMTENPLKLSGTRYSMDLEDLKRKIDKDTRMILLCSPHNPAGNVWTRKELEDLTEICLKNDIVIISDEIHSDIVFKPGKHVPTASLSPEVAENTITLMSPTKTFNIAGLMTSISIIPNEKLRTRFNRIINNFHLSQGHIFGGIALDNAYRCGEEWLEELLLYLKNNIEFLGKYIETYLPEIKVIYPEATYLVWLDMRKMPLAPEKLNEFLVKEAGLGLSEGSIFGDNGKGYQRINIACPKAILESSLEKLRKAVEKLRN